MNSIPAGPIEREPYPDFDKPLPSNSEQEAALREALAAAGVELGAYDERIVQWLSGWEWQTIATIASWVQRAGQEQAK